ncbi:hypothetical protein HK100_009880, partial [Physocladia obscura]
HQFATQLHQENAIIGGEGSFINFLKDVKRAGANAVALQKETSATKNKPFNLEYYKDEDNKNILRAISYNSPSSSSDKKGESNTQQVPLKMPITAESIAIARDALKRQEQAINAQQHVSEEALKFKRSQLHAEQVQVDLQRKKVDLSQRELDFSYSSESDASNNDGNNREKQQTAQRTVDKEIEKLKRMTEELRVNQRRVRDEERRKMKQEVGKLRILEKQSKSIGGWEDRWKETARIRQEKGEPFVESDGTAAAATDTDTTTITTPNGFFGNIWSSIFNVKSKATNAAEEIMDRVGEQFELSGKQLERTEEQFQSKIESTFVSQRHYRSLSPTSTSTAAAAEASEASEASELAKSMSAFALAEPNSVNARLLPPSSAVPSHIHDFFNHHHYHHQFAHYPQSPPPPLPLSPMPPPPPLSSMPPPPPPMPSLLSPPPPSPSVLFVGWNALVPPMPHIMPLLPPIPVSSRYSAYTGTSSVIGDFGSTPPSYESELPPVPTEEESVTDVVPTATPGKENPGKKEFKIRFF